MLALPNQLPGLIEQYGLTRSDVDREVWAIDAEGRKYSAALAANRALQELGGGWALLSRLYTIPPFRWIEDWVYGWIAEHRPMLSRWWGVTPPCDQPDVHCDS